MTFAHEVGHNMGAQHDEDAGCTSGYIMSESGSTKSSHMDQEFSSCSIKAIHDQIDTVKSKRLRNCFKHKVEKDNDQDFSICGDYVVEGDEECDCGMSFKTCSDPCCYAAHISPEDLAWNKSATPCRSHKSPICLSPFRSALIFGLIGPWIFIGCSIIALLAGLCYDWNHDKKCYKHVSNSVIETSHVRISKSEPRTPPPLSNSRPTSPKTAVLNHRASMKSPAPPPPPVPPYVPPSIRSHSQPPPISLPSLRLSSGLASPPINFRPPDPPPPVPDLIRNDATSPRLKSPPTVPYNTRPHVSQVAYLAKKFESKSDQHS